MKAETRQSGLFEAHKRLDGASPERITPYPAYRPSEVRWLGDVPEHWLVRKLKFISSLRFSNVDKKSVEGEQPVRLCNYVDVYSRDYVTPDIEFMEATASGDEVRRFAVERGNVLITKDSEAWDDIAVPAYADAEFDGVLCGYHLAQVRPDPAIVDGEYLSRAFASHAIRDQFCMAANGITRFGLSKDSIGSSLFPVPPVDEQRAIAAFLRRETARIDELVAKKRRLIELLQEKRTATISHAVTKGLNPDAPMKPSGIRSLDYIPAHWDLVPLMYRTAPGHKIMYGIVLPGPHFPGGVPIVKGGNVDAGRLRRELLLCTDPAIEAGYGRSRLRAGDLVYAIRGSIGACELVPDDCDGVNITQDAAKIAPDRSVERGWLLYAMKSPPVFAQLESRALGATIRGINIRDLKRCKMPLPPRREQQAIFAHLNQHVGRLTTIVQQVESVIDKLQEYRTALISAAVTGKIDVRGPSDRRKGQ